MSRGATTCAALWEAIVVEMPYDYSSPLRGDGTDVPNVPSPAGAALGRELSRFVDVEEAANRVLYPHVPRRCDDCAFLLGTVPNQCMPTVADALKCTMEGEPFYCHKGLLGGAEPRRLCAGWLALARAGDVLRLITKGGAR